MRLESCISRMSEMLFWRWNQGKEMLARPLVSLSLLRFLPWRLNVHTIRHRLFNAEQFNRCFGFQCDGELARGHRTATSLNVMINHCGSRDVYYELWSYSHVPRLWDTCVRHMGRTRNSSSGTLTPYHPYLGYIVSMLSILITREFILFAASLCSFETKERE